VLNDILYAAPRTRRGLATFQRSAGNSRVALCVHRTGLLRRRMVAKPSCYASKPQKTLLRGRKRRATDPLREEAVATIIGYGRAKQGLRLSWGIENGDRALHVSGTISARTRAGDTTFSHRCAVHSFTEGFGTRDFWSMQQCFSRDNDRQINQETR